MSEGHEKGLEFEKKVAEFFRKKNYNKVLLREKVVGKSGIKHEVDVLVFDNLDQTKIVWACQCKFWNAKIGKKEIGEWIQTCRDIGARPAFASLKFSSEARKYAEANGVFLITEEQLEIEPSQVVGQDFLSWKEKLDTITNELDKFLFCLKSIYQTEILQNAERARKENEEELRFENPQLFMLFIEPTDQRLTKFLICLNKIKSTFYYDYAFGPLAPNIGIRLSRSLTEGYSIPSEIDKVLNFITSILSRFNVGDLEPFKIDYGDKCRIFLVSWCTIADSNLNIEKEIEVWREKNKPDQLNPFYAYPPYIIRDEPYMTYDNQRRIIIGIPKNPKTAQYIQNIKDFWRFYLSTKKDLDIEKLSLLFKTDLSMLNEEDKCPVINGKEDVCEIFKRSIVIKKAYENNKSKVEKIIYDLKAEQ